MRYIRPRFICPQGASWASRAREGSRRPRCSGKVDPCVINFGPGSADSVSIEIRIISPFPAPASESGGLIKTNSCLAQS
ncbi:hypothetical protein EVAR_90761_1 [Eumeta japonica]|uniref:Uncharacterized protein n=1 Tax=Eumeta variegata TaxID=151549 RepID=A0A4C1SJ21_EUMVA|nr:hypothetical protein EVAR_90761_1 [Eumeta japonica]